MTPPHTRCILFTGLVIIQAVLAQPNESETETRAVEAAESYRALFAEIESFQKDLGDSYEAQLYPKNIDDESSVIPLEDRAKFEKTIPQHLQELARLADEPAVDWGLREEFEEKGPNLQLVPVDPIRHLVQGAIWYAQNNLDSDPEGSIETLVDAMAVARQQYQVPTLITHMVQNAVENLVTEAVGEMLPAMSPEQKEAFIAGVDALPQPRKSIKDAIAGERDFFSGWLRNKLAKELALWETQQRGELGYRFPEDLRLAGIILLPNTPARISIDNTYTGDTFWIEENQEIKGLLFKKIDHKLKRAWIHQGENVAVVDLKRSTIQRDSFPEAVLNKVLTEIFLISSEQSQDVMKEFGIDPKTFVSQLDALYDAQTEALNRLDDPIEDIKAWEDQLFDKDEKNSFVGMIYPTISRIVQSDRETNLNREAMHYLLANDASLESPQTQQDLEILGYTIESHSEGYSIIPNEFIESENRPKNVLEISKPTATANTP